MARDNTTYALFYFAGHRPETLSDKGCTGFTVGHAVAAAALWGWYTRGRLTFQLFLSPV